MRIGIDATTWASTRGYGRFTRELVTALAGLAGPHELVCFLDPLSAEGFRLERPGLRRVVVSQSAPPTRAAATGSRRSIPDLLRLSRAVRQARLDVFFSPSVYGYFPLPPGLPAVVTIHDAIPERFPALTLPSRRDRLFWRAKIRLALRQARLITTVSDYAAREIERHLRVPAVRLRVTLEGVTPVFRPSGSGADTCAAAARAGVPSGHRWFVYVGGFGPHKYVDVLIRAHADVARRRSVSPPVLLLVGAETDAFHQDVGSLRRAIAACGTDRLVRWTGYLPDEELRHLHSGAVALVLPSASEGFGLPAVEAARCGTPIVATLESPLPVLLEGGGLFVPPGDVPALGAAMERLLADEPLRLAMGHLALERASALSWSRSAGLALDALREAAAS